MAEPFYYLSDEDVVPRDAVHVIIGGSVTVVEPGTFRGYQNLERVELQEGVEEIMWNAFENCPNLTRVDCPSSLRTIRHHAFSGCPRLSEVVLREGLRRIGEAAFDRCDLRRIVVPSSVLKIGVGAFAHCDDLEAVTLAGRMVMLGQGAFSCPRLELIVISSMAIVVRAREDGNCHTKAVTGGIEIERDPANGFHRLILCSPHLVLMPPEELSNLTGAIERIADTTRGARPLNLADEDVSDRIRDCFVNHLSTWYGSYKTEVATILELGLWKIELGLREASRSRAAAGGETAGADVPTREDCRGTCGADPIVGLVLSSLAGPHRRADQSENAGSIRPQGGNSPCPPAQPRFFM